MRRESLVVILVLLVVGSLGVGYFAGGQVNVRTTTSTSFISTTTTSMLTSTLTTRQTVVVTATAVNTTTPAQTVSRMPGVLWNKIMNFTSGVEIYSPDDDGIGPVAMSQDGSEIVVGTGQAIGNGSIYAFDSSGRSLWNYTLNHFVASISMSANGSLIVVGTYDILPGPAGIAANGAVCLLTGQGKLVWTVSIGADNPVGNVLISKDGSKIVVEAENDIIYMNSEGQTLWSFKPHNGNINGLDMSPDAGNLVASVMYRPNTPNWSWSFLSFNGGGKLLWNYTSISLGGISASGGVTLASDGFHTWSSSAVSGYNGTLYLFDNKGDLLWSRQIYSPALAIQTANGSQDAVVLTNWSALVFNEGGQLLANYTDLTTVNLSPSCVYPSFSTGFIGYSDVLFLSSQGVPLSRYSQGGGVSFVVLSPNDHYAIVVSNQDHGSVLSFVEFVANGSSCS